MKLSFFGPKMAVSWRICVFQKKFAETPIFIVFFGCALFGPSCQKREILDTHPKKKKLFTDNWKAHFWVFLFFLVFFSFFVFLFFFVLFFFFWCFFWRVEGSCEVARRATSLGPKPSLFVFLFLFLFFCFFFGFFVGWGGPKGHLTWP